MPTQTATPRRSAVSYARFSDPSQAKGDSETRQDRDYHDFCSRHNLAPGKQIFIDRGRSGFRGAHRTKGALGVLVERAKAGGLDPGTVVVVEAWDRLGRMRPDKQTALVSELLHTGVDIGVCKLNEIFTLEDFGTHKWTTLAVFIQLAYQESKQKSDRLKSAWEGRRKRARETGAKLLGSLPAWIEPAGDELRLIPERARAVHRIYQLAIDGNGAARIARTLEAEKVKPFGIHKVNAFRTRSAFSGRWTKAYVAKLLRDRRTVGELQLTKGGKPDGAPLAGYFPAVVTEDVFNAVRAAQSQKGKRHTRQRKYVNVFRGLLTNARDGVPLNMASSGHSRNELHLKNNGATAGHIVTIPYAMFERCILRCLREIRPADILPADERPTNRAETIRADLAAVRLDIAGLKADLDGAYSKGLADVLRRKEAREIELVNYLTDELARVANPLSKSWDDAAGLLAALDAAEDKDAMRVRIRAAIARIVESAVVLVAGTKTKRLFAVQFDFVGGARRTWIIRYLSPTRWRADPPEPDVQSVTWEAGENSLDLRQKAHVAAMEKILQHMNFEKLSMPIASAKPTKQLATSGKGSRK